MPIDPSLITDTLARWQTPQFTMPDPLAQYAKIQALKNGIMQQQSDALDLQQKQKNIADTAAIDQAFANAKTTDATGNVTYDRNKVLTNVPGSHVAMLQKTFTDADKSAADLSTAKSNAAEAANKLSASYLSGIIKSGYDPDVAHGVVIDAVGNNVIPQAQGAAILQAINQNRTPAGVKAVIDPLIARSPDVQKILADVETADTKKATEDRAAQKAKDDPFINAVGGAASQMQLDALRQHATAAGVSQNVIDQAPTAIADVPAYRRSRLTADQITTTDQAAATAEETKKRDEATEAARKVTQAQEDKRIGISAQDLALRNQEFQKKYGDALGNLSDNDKAVATKLAAGELNPSTLGRLPNKEQILAGAIQINPNWTQATYDTKQSFTNPEKTQAKNLGTISRIVSHIGQFEQNSQQMGFAPLYATGVNLTGNQAALNEDAHAISGELEKLVSGGVGSEGQTQAWQKALHSPSATARQQAVDEISHLIGGQYEGMNQTYKSAIGSDLPVEKYVSPAGQAWMKSKGINVTNAAPGAGPAAAGGIGGGQAVSKQDVQDYATKHNLSYAAAEAHVKSNGYTVNRMANPLDSLPPPGQNPLDALPPPKPQDWSDKLGLTNSAARAVVDLGEGATAGLASTIFHGGDLVRRMTGQDRIINDPAVQEHMRAPASFAGGAGKFLEQAAEFALPGSVAAEATKGASLAARALAQAAVGSGVSAAQTGGDPMATAAGGALGGGAEVIGPLVSGVKAAIAEKSPTLANWAESFGNATPTQKARISRSLDVLSSHVPPDSVHETQDLVNSELDKLSQAYNALDPAIKARGIDAATVVGDLQKLQGQYMRRGVVTNDELYNAVSDQIAKIQNIAKANGGKLNVDDLVHMKLMANGRTNWQSPDVEQSLWNNIGDAYRRAADIVAPETTPLNRDFQKYSDLKQIIDKNIAQGKGTTPSGLDLLLKKGIAATAGAKAGGALGAPAGPVGMSLGAFGGAIAGPRLAKAAAQALQNAVDSGALRTLSPARQGLIRSMAAMGDNAGLLKVLGVAATEESAVGR